MIAIQRLTASAYTVPTAAPESDGTLSWDRTTLVVVEAEGGDRTGIGFTYSHGAAATVVRDTLAAAVEGRDAMGVDAAWWAMLERVRNVGREGIAACAISAVDLALWDLKAQLLGVPLVTLLGAVRDEIPAYASGGFTSEDRGELMAELSRWRDEGFSMAKIKIGREGAAERVAAAREALGDGVSLFIDANGAFTPRRALTLAHEIADHRVVWFEEPVSSDDLAGLRRVREGAPAGMDVAAGEYGWDPFYFRRMLAAGAVDVLQADVTRCLGISGLLRVAHECEACNTPLSFHCAPSMSVHAACALRGAVHAEYFHDHQRIERALFDGAAVARGGMLAPDTSSPGHGIAFKRVDAERYAV